VQTFLEQLWKELVERTYRPQKAWKVEIPKGGGKMRRLSIPIDTYFCTVISVGADPTPPCVATTG
jgi:hypothetical protein